MDDGLHDNLVKRIRKLARRHGWSMNRTADAAGISRSGLSNIMRKTKSPTLDTVAKLAAAFEVSALELLAADDPAPAVQVPRLSKRSELLK